ncbi:peptidyl-tRNA hydrolase [Enterococcus canis]|uniref:Peptidyl-tRNA hydrolase n=1 Tax=Enterococcus canis TaxID=214095 RepID=A0A1L8RC57_9ENTE|nr:aminoacyl-tRNA hydrolase [Enterococcus canis]OJG17338.1 peptidyl-tRNA hydrolase [Enterococcus canis]
MKMIVGLGNPGSKYAATKHNVGFQTVDELARRHQVTFKKNPFEAEVAEFFQGTEKILLVKPQTFMNESGRAVGPLMTYFGLLPEELVVIYDDLDMEPGRIRLREKGSAGGHNGMKSIMQHLGTQTFKRVKIGIGRPEGRDTVVHHVLSPFPKSKQAEMEIAMKMAADATDYYLDDNSFIDTMNRYN